MGSKSTSTTETFNMLYSSIINHGWNSANGRLCRLKVYTYKDVIENPTKIAILYHSKSCLILTWSCKGRWGLPRPLELPGWAAERMKLSGCWPCTRTCRKCRPSKRHTPEMLNVLTLQLWPVTLKEKLSQENRNTTNIICCN